MKLNKIALLCASVMSFGAFASGNATLNNGVYFTGWNQSKNVEGGQVTSLDAMENLNQVSTFNLAFGRWDANGNIEGREVLTEPKFDEWWMPTSYVVWTNFKYKHPDARMMASFGGFNDADIWSLLSSEHTREDLATNLVNLLNHDFPVYEKNGKYSQIGSVRLDGIDFDFEAPTRMTENQIAELQDLIRRVRTKDGNSHPISVATYGVAADPSACQQDGVTENCSYTLLHQRSVHAGEIIPLLETADNLIDYYNIMAYDSGHNYDYDIGLTNFAQHVDKSKVILGNSITSQWAPEGNFVESQEKNNERAIWAASHGFGGVFAWDFGASVENVSYEDQANKISEFTRLAELNVGAVDTPIVSTEGHQMGDTIVIKDKAQLDKLYNSDEYMKELLNKYEVIKLVVDANNPLFNMILPRPSDLDVANAKIILDRTKANSSETTSVTMYDQFGISGRVDSSTDQKVYTYTLADGKWNLSNFVVDWSTSFDNLINNQDNFAKLVSNVPEIDLIFRNETHQDRVVLPSVNGSGEVHVANNAEKPVHIVTPSKDIEIDQYVTGAVRLANGHWDAMPYHISAEDAQHYTTYSPRKMVATIGDARKAGVQVVIE